jgi:hypothetical protein
LLSGTPIAVQQTPMVESPAAVLNLTARPPDLATARRGKRRANSQHGAAATNRFTSAAGGATLRQDTGLFVFKQNGLLRAGFGAILETNGGAIRAFVVHSWTVFSANHQHYLYRLLRIFGCSSHKVADYRCFLPLEAIQA